MASEDSEKGHSSTSVTPGVTMPRTVWQWLSLCAPAIAALLALWAAEVWLPPIPKLRLHEGTVEVVNVGAMIRRALIVSLGTMAVFSLPLAIVFTRSQSWPNRIASVVGVTVVLVFLNSFVAFGGCVVVSVVGNATSR